MRLIDADAFEKELEYQKGNWAYDNDTEAEMAIDMCIDALHAFPTAEGAPVVHGRWIIGDGDDDFDVKCPVCGWSDVFDVCGIWLVKDIAAEMHYCQNCGAKMDLEV